MSAGAGALTFPRRGPHPATRRLLEVALVLAVGLGTIGALAAVRDPAVPAWTPGIVTQDAPTHGRHPDAGPVADDDLMKHGRHGEAPTRAADR